MHRGEDDGYNRTVQAQLNEQEHEEEYKHRASPRFGLRLRRRHSAPQLNLAPVQVML